MSHTARFPRDTRSTLIATLGADFQTAIAPYKADILDLARRLRGDVHRAAMHLLIERRGHRPTAMEQQLIVAALEELQATDTKPPQDILARVADRLNRFCETPDAHETVAPGPL